MDLAVIKAKEYAGNTLIKELLSGAIEKAFENGYNAGYDDGLAAREPKYDIDVVTYVDLGLPSGTKWAASYLKDEQGKTVYLTYSEAEQLNIPTEEQYMELINNCVFKPVDPNPDKFELDGYQILSKNGKHVTYLQEGYYSGEQIIYIGDPMFWINKHVPEEEKRRCVAWMGGRTFTAEVFMGYRLPIILVR